MPNPLPSSHFSALLIRGEGGEKKAAAKIGPQRRVPSSIRIIAIVGKQAGKGKGSLLGLDWAGAPNLDITCGGFVSFLSYAVSYTGIGGRWKRDERTCSSNHVLLMLSRKLLSHV